jgi:hypothetical protein
LLLSLLGAPGARAQTVADFVGTWRLDPSATRAATFDGPDTRITTTQLTVSRVGEGLTVQRVIGPTTVTATYDPTPPSTAVVGLRGQARTARTSWAGSTLVIEETEVVQQPAGTATVTVTERWTVQEDGRLRIDVTSDTGTSTLTRTDRYLRQP